MLNIKTTRGISHKVYMNFFKAGRGQILFLLLLLFLVIRLIADISSSWLFSQWNSSTERPEFNITVATGPVSRYGSVWFITVLSGLVISMTVTSLTSGAMASMFLNTASRRLYNKMFDVVLRAPMHFFETNPVGQILNRFSRDTGFMDIVLTIPFFQSMKSLLLDLGLTIYACVNFPWMTLVVILFMVISTAFMAFARRGIQDSKRIEGSLRSPTYSHLSATIQGLTVIRAFRKQESFLRQAYSHMNRHTAAWHTYLCTQRFIGIRIDFFASALIVSYILVSVITATPDAETSGATAGAIGLAFVFLVSVLGTFQFALLQVADVLSVMTSVERIQQFGGLEQEAPEHTDVVPYPGWPNQGHIKLKDMTLTYKHQDQAALGPITVQICPSEKVGVVGRTGAGKSSLFVSLLRMVEPTGSILIDGIEVTEIGLTNLRTNISVIPQDPVLFTGPLRQNLDPFEEFTDDHVWKALHQVQLHNKVSSLFGGLSAEMGEAGDNFSIGEKQLLCMARALMRKNKIIIVDEATANVDYRTDQTIQDILSREFAASTVLTIAHRLNTVITYDKIMVLEAGRLVEFDHPHTLLEDRFSVFHEMVQRMGDASYGSLCEQALTSFSARKRIQNEHSTAQNSVDVESDGMAFINRAFVSTKL